VVFSLLAHVLVVALLASAGPLDLSAAAPALAPRAVASGEGPAVEDDRPMEIETIVNQLDRPEEKTADEKRREEEAKKEEEDKNPHGQVVDIARPLVEERPDKANYVSEFDSKVEHETKGPNARERAGAKAQPEGAAAEAQPTPPSPSGTGGGEPALPVGRPDARPGRPGPLAMRELHERASGQSRAASEEPADRDGELVPPGRRTPGGRTDEPGRAPGEQGAGVPPGAARAPSSDSPSARPGAGPNLMASREMLERAIGRGSGSMDYLKDVDDGESTALNSKKWKHAPFFNRVKRAVANEWHPEVVYVRHDPSGNVYGVKDRVTVLRVHLLPDGKLAAWTVLQSSGVDFLDDEAIDAFRKAAPFPNPPRDLVESDGQVHFNFAFIFELSGHTSLKVYKYQ
jgi:TonB family protein